MPGLFFSVTLVVNGLTMVENGLPGVALNVLVLLDVVDGVVDGVVDTDVDDVFAVVDVVVAVVVSGGGGAVVGGGAAVVDETVELDWLVGVDELLAVEAEATGVDCG